MGVARGAKTQAVWRTHSRDAATGLGLLPWRGLRRVLGLTPWSEQLLFRLKHHALSAYNPVSAGFHCPHPECAKVARVDLYHIFWLCPAAARLRKVMLERWQSAGLRTDSYETAFFSLTLPEIPSQVARITGQLLAADLWVDAGAHGDFVERILAHCWSLGAALYFHSIWRWRVAFFDPHNDVTRAHQEASYAARLRSGHATVARECCQGRLNSAVDRAGRAVCEMLGGNRTGPHHRSGNGDSAVILFIAGRTTGTPEQGLSGVMVARVHFLTRASQMMYLKGSRYPGKRPRAQKAIYVGLLGALRVCLQRGWGPVHVAGDNALAIRLMETRKAPRGSGPVARYWAAKRMADAVGVVSWTRLPRERNRAAHAILGVALSSQTDALWETRGDRNGEGKWAMVTALVPDDVRQWCELHGEVVRSKDPEHTV
jgi:ribonuclease HI